MPEIFPMIMDVECGRWARSRTSEDSPGSVHVFVPRGFEAYARILHPLSRETEKDPVPPELVVRWADVARSFGTTMHTLADLDALARRPWSGEADIVTPTGATYEWPASGLIPSNLLAHLVGILASFTTTPDDGVAGV